MQVLWAMEVGRRERRGRTRTREDEQEEGQEEGQEEDEDEEEEEEEEEDGLWLFVDKLPGGNGGRGGGGAVFGRSDSSERWGLDLG
ncbi:unnamed protein product [Cutaneotrichosporon oleaginosum]